MQIKLKNKFLPKIFLVMVVVTFVESVSLAKNNVMKGAAMQTIDAQKTVILIDGSGFLYRAYYGLRPLHTIQGIPVQAVYSFCRMIKKLINKFDPHYITLVWDSKGATTRHELFPDYKATRQEAPSDLFEQKKYIQQFAELIGLSQIEQVGVEADDLMYSLAKDFAQQDYHILLITSDKDMVQTLTISSLINIFDPFKDIFINRTDAEKTLEFSLEKLPFYYALVGDSSDNIPGVKGIGKKGATTLVQQFESLSDMYNNINKITSERTKKLLLEQQENAFLSQKLFQLQYHPLNISLRDVQFAKENWQQARPLFQELNFTSLLKDRESEKLQQQTIVQKIPLSILKGYKFITIQTKEQLEELCKKIQEKKICAIDTEGTGIDPLEDDLVGICIAVEYGIAYYIPVAHHVPDQQLLRKTVLDALKPILLDPTIAKVMHHAKFDQLMLYHYGYKVENMVFDTLLAAHLVTQDWQRIGLKALSEYYLKEQMLSFSEVVSQFNYKNFSYVPLDRATEYAATDAHQTLRLLPILQEELRKQDMEELYYTIEHPLLKILLQMEEHGIVLNREILQELDKKVCADLAQLKSDIISLIGPDYQQINLNSPKQLEQLLFQHLKLPPQKKSSKKTGYSTDVTVLQELAKLHPVPGLIVKYRELFKLKSTYIDALPTYINKETGRIHTNFSQTAVATGRLSSSDPNLQNIPTHTDYDIHIRTAFIPDPEHLFLSADYSQIELRVLAYLSQDEQLLYAFNHNLDIHAQTASKLFDVPIAQVTHEQRQIGKRINFSILYGLTPYGLSQDLKIPFKDAKFYIEKYFAQYPGICSWMEATIEQTKKCGYVITLWGRRRYVPGIYEKNRTLYDLARRIAINTVAQGTAAELMKIGMIKLQKALQEHSLDAKMVLQIHDELILSVPESQQKETEQLVKNTLESVVDWNVPLQVIIRYGKNWQEVTK